MNRMIIALLTMFALAPTLAAAADEPMTIKPSPYSVKETMDRLAAALAEKGLKPAARIDHAAGAKSAGLEMPPTEVMMFGNPRLGTPLMLADPRIAIDLPMRVVAWQDKAGKVWIGYTSADGLKARYAITGRDDSFKAMAGALEAFTSAATKR